MKGLSQSDVVGIFLVNWWNIMQFLDVQTPGEVFVMGSGYYGALGKGEDVTEALRPLSSSVFDQEVCHMPRGGITALGVTTPYPKNIKSVAFCISEVL